MPTAADHPDGQDRNNDDGAAAVVVPPARPVEPPPPAHWRAAAAALAGGVLTAALGTALHAHVWYVGGAGLPVGALVAVVLAISVAVYVALWARNVLMAALTGVVAYLLVGLAASAGAGGFIAAGVQVDGVTPPVAVAGSVWVIGLAVGTVIAVAVAWRVLRRSARQPGSAHPSRTRRSETPN